MESARLIDSKYLPGEELARGPSYVLRRAIHAASGDAVLVKTPIQDPPRPLDVAGLAREAQVTAQLSGARVLPIRELGAGALVFDAVDGEPLSRVAVPVLSLYDFLRLAVDLARAIGEVHRAGLSHRRLRRESVLVGREPGRLWLTDLHAASSLTDVDAAPASRSPPDPREMLSPEQTGRMNRAVDHRCDFYAVGAIYHELLTGQRLFETKDPLEFAHAQIAKAPPSPSSLRPEVPQALSNIVTKLLSKMAEDRYQSAEGLVADLERFEAQWSRGGAAPFALGTAERAHRFTLPQRLYGRDSQREALRSAYARATAGEKVFVFVSGEGGSGKTSLIHELRHEVTGQSGRFASGKFDAVERGVPYSALSDALGMLCRDPALVPRLRSDLGAGAAVLGSVAPEFKERLAPLPDVPPLGPSQTENRLAAAFQSLLEALTGDGTPFVLFLDDLQWADAGTMRLLASAFDGGAARAFLFVGAYRDGEVSSGDPVARLRRTLDERGASQLDLRLSPLRPLDLTLLLRDALRRDDAELDVLAQVIQEKTDGNPYFVARFLESMGELGLLTFDAQKGFWSFDAAAARAATMTDNVLELMGRKLRRLPPRTVAALEVAACLGDPFCIGIVASVLGVAPAAAAEVLWEAIREGVLAPVRDDYEVALAAATDVTRTLELRFSHDRVKQAAYAGIAEQARPGLHLAIGRALLLDGASSQATLFEAVSHLNRGSVAMHDAAERARLAELNLSAGRQARTRGAVQSALEHFRAGLSLREGAEPDGIWAALSVEAAECEFLSGEEASAEERLAAVQRARVPVACKVEASRVRVVRYENTGRFDLAIDVARAALTELGWPVPSDASERERALEGELARVTVLRGGRPYEALAELPEMSRAEDRQLARILFAVWPSAFLRNEGSLTALLSARLVRLSLEAGAAPESALGYITHAITLNTRSGDYAAGTGLGQAGLALVERYDDPALAVPVMHLYGSFLAPFGEPFAVSRKRAELCHSRAVACGDFTHASRAAFLSTWYAFFGGETLPSFEERVATVVGFARRVHHEMIERASQVTAQWAKALRGRTESPRSLGDEVIPNDALDAAFARVPIFRGFVAVARGYLALTFGAPEEARRQSEIAREALRGSAETLWHAMLDFLGGAAIVASATEGALDAESDAALDSAIARIDARRKAFGHNFAHQYFILEGERARLRGDLAAAEAALVSAVAAADENGSLPARALAREVHARTAKARGDEAAALRHLRAAASFYAAWGATAKVQALEEAHPELSHDTQRTTARDFDAESALRAAHAISAEIRWDALLPSLVRIVVENAAAERGLLIEVRGGELLVVAEGGTTQDFTVLSPPAPVESRPDVPRTIVESVVRSSLAVLSGDARTDPELCDDPHVRRAAPRSLLCVPIARDGKVAYVVYLENTLAADVFTGGRVEVIRVLAAQAAISLENARLYQSMKTEIARRAEAEARLERAVEDLESLKNRLQAENVYLQEEIRSAHDFEEIVGNSPSLLEALGRVERVAGTDSTVLVTGETGTGKELFARAIHARSPRSGRPLVKVNCGAIATGLVESELFGHVKGAFTGALSRRVGRFELADGGTLFLDEVSELPPEAQTKLLRVLQEREFEPVGSSKTIRVDVRVIAATNKSLDVAVRAGKFRADLLYRLNVFPVGVPALRDRPGDIPLLVAFFVTRLAKKLGKDLQGFSNESMERLLDYSWPGNVRELQNVVERAAVFARGPVLDVRSLTAEDPAPASRPARPVEGKTLQDMEREHIVKVLETSGWVIEGARGAATALGLHPNTLRSRMKKLGIARARS